MLASNIYTHSKQPISSSGLIRVFYSDKQALGTKLGEQPFPSTELFKTTVYYLQNI